MGIKISVLDDRHLIITINGAKVTEQNGQPWRKLTFCVSQSEEAARLWQIASRKGGNILVKREPRTFHQNLEGAWPREHSNAAGLRLKATGGQGWLCAGERDSCPKGSHTQPAEPRDVAIKQAGSKKW